MLISPGLRLFLVADPVDLRGSFYRLASYVRGTLDLDPQAPGHLYVFLGKRGSLVKILFWDRSGYCIFAKRLERARFRLPSHLPRGVTSHEIDFATLTLLLEGIDLSGATRRLPYRHPIFGEKRRLF
jgi:transposase